MDSVISSRLIRLRSLSLIAAAFILCEGFASFTEGNEVQLLYCGRSFYPTLLESIESAQESICMEYFSFRDDRLSQMFLEILARKAENGVSTYLIVDWSGCSMEDVPTDDRFFDQYRKRGVNIAVFNPFRIYQPVPRDHRKLSVIDGKTAYVGGINFSEKNYFKNATLGPTKDMALKLKGPVVAELLTLFADSWKACTSSLPALPSTSVRECGGNVSISVAQTKGVLARPRPEEFFLELLNSAESSIRIVNAYFMPSMAIKRALRKAAERGVKIYILLGGNTDLPKLLAGLPFSTARSLSEHDGISVHIQKGCFIHEKAISTDGKTVMIGSTNLDFLSLYINRELSVIIKDSLTTRQFNAIFDSECHE